MVLNLDSGIFVRFRQDDPEKGKKIDLSATPLIGWAGSHPADRSLGWVDLQSFPPKNMRASSLKWELNQMANLGSTLPHYQQSANNVKLYATVDSLAFPDDFLVDPPNYAGNKDDPLVFVVMSSQQEDDGDEDDGQDNTNSGGDVDENSNDDEDNNNNNDNNNDNDNNYNDNNDDNTYSNNDDNDYSNNSVPGPYSNFTKRIQCTSNADWSRYAPEAIQNTQPGEILWTDGNLAYGVANQMAYMAVRRYPNTPDGNVIASGRAVNNPAYFVLLG